MLIDYHVFKKLIKKCKPSKMIHNYVSCKHECNYI